VRIPPDGFLFLAGEFRNGLVTHEINLSRRVPAVVASLRRPLRSARGAADGEHESQAAASAGLAEGEEADFAMDKLLLNDQSQYG
jgi:hypothetical protein